MTKPAALSKEEKAAQKRHQLALKNAMQANRIEHASTDRLNTIVTPSEIITGEKLTLEGVNPKKKEMNFRPSPWPIQQTMLQESKLKKIEKVIKATMSLEASRYLIAGFNQGLPGRAHASHFTCNPNMTLAGIRRRENKDYKFDRSKMGHTPLKYRVYGGVLRNVEENKNGRILYLPRPMGGEFTFENVNVLHNYKMKTDDPLMNGSPDFPLDFRYRSIIFPLTSGSEHLKAFIADQFKEKKKSNAEQRGNILFDIINKISHASVGIDTMAYEVPFSRRFYTSDYETFLCQIHCEKSHEFDDHVECKISVHRKMVVSVSNSSNKNEDDMPYLIPLCEEATIYIQIRSECVYQNTSRCYVMSAVPKMESAGDKATHLHVFSDNAYTLFLPRQEYEMSDRHEAAMKSIGMLIKEHDNIKRGANEKTIERYSTVVPDCYSATLDESAKQLQNYVKNLITSKKNQYKINQDIKDRSDDFDEYIKRNATRQEQLSVSFLGNQADKTLITTDEINAPTIDHWFASSTFSFVAIRPSATVAGNGPPKVYGFVQTFAMVKSQDEPQLKLSGVQSQTDPVSSQRPITPGNYGRHTASNRSSTEIAPSPLARGPSLRQETKIESSGPHTRSEEESPISRGAVESATETWNENDLATGKNDEDFLSKGPGNDMQSKYAQDNAWNKTKLSRLASTSSQRSRPAIYKSSLPPELELELELL